MSVDLEDVVRHVFHDSAVPVRAVEPDDVLRIGGRVRTIRRRRLAASGIAAAGLVGIGVAQVVVPASGSPLTPIVWAAGPVHPGSEAGPWVTGNGHRYVMSIRDAYLGDRNALVISAVEPDGSVRDLMAQSPVRSEDLPLVGMAVSTEPGVSFALFPAGAHGIEAFSADGNPQRTSTLRISSPHGGLDYVAVAASTDTPDDVITRITWVDDRGRVNTWGN